MREVRKNDREGDGMKIIKVALVGLILTMMMSKSVLASKVFGMSPVTDTDAVCNPMANRQSVSYRLSDQGLGAHTVTSRYTLGSQWVERDDFSLVYIPQSDDRIENFEIHGSGWYFSLGSRKWWYKYDEKDGQVILADGIYAIPVAGVEGFNPIFSFDEDGWMEADTYKTGYRFDQDGYMRFEGQYVVRKDGNDALFGPEAEVYLTYNLQTGAILNGPYKLAVLKDIFSTEDQKYIKTEFMSRGWTYDEIAKAWRYLDPGEELVKNGSKWIEGYDGLKRLYFFNEQGYMMSNEEVRNKIGQVTLSEEGAMMKNGIVQVMYEGAKSTIVGDIDRVIEQIPDWNERMP